MLWHNKRSGSLSTILKHLRPAMHHLQKVLNRFFHLFWSICSHGEGELWEMKIRATLLNDNLLIQWKIRYRTIDNTWFLIQSQRSSSNLTRIYAQTHYTKTPHINHNIQVFHEPHLLVRKVFSSASISLLTHRKLKLSSSIHRTLEGCTS